MPADCPSATESVAGKYSAEAQAAWEGSPGPHEVVVTVRSAAQTCVRALVSRLGGTASHEVLGHGFPATLSWSQIQGVAAHPDVAYVEPRYGNPPPASAPAPP